MKPVYYQLSPNDAVARLRSDLMLSVAPATERVVWPELPRFISPDPVSGKLETPITWNRYLYCRNDPINYIDPDGRRDRRTDAQRELTDNPAFKKAVRKIIAKMDLHERRVRNRREAGTLIIRNNDGEVSFTEIRRGTATSVELEDVFRQADGSFMTARGEVVECSLHGHVGAGRVDGQLLDPWDASEKDQAWSDTTGLDSYIIVEDTGLLVYEPNTRAAQRILTGNAFREYLRDDSNSNNED